MKRTDENGSVIRKYTKAQLADYVEKIRVDTEDEENFVRCLIRVRTDMSLQNEKEFVLQQLYQKKISLSHFSELIRIYIWDPADVLFELFTCALEEEQTVVAISLLKDAYEYGHTDAKIVKTFIEFLRLLGQDENAVLVEEKYQKYRKEQEHERL